MSKKVGVAFSGGGGRGFFHIGAIKAFRELDIRPAVIAGSSAGSLAGLCWAAGVSDEEALSAMPSRPVYNFKNLAPGYTGLSRLKTLREFLEKEVGKQRFEDLSIPFFSVCTNLDTAEATAVNKGPIVDWVLASCAIPIFVKPVEIDGMYYADGGISCNLPGRFIRDDCDILIGINLFPPCIWPKERRSGYINIFQRSLELFLYHNTLSDQDMCDILITNEELGLYLPYDYSNRDIMYRMGYETTMKALKETDLEVLND